MANTKAQKRQKFEDVFSKLREELLDHLKQEGMPEDVVAWFKRVRLVLRLSSAAYTDRDYVM